MLMRHWSGRIAAALALGLAPGISAPSWAQNPPVSSGSGAGTGTGREAGSGLGTTGTGSESGAGLGTTGTGRESGAGPQRAPIPPGPVRVPRGMFDPGAGRSPTFPTDVMPPADSVSPYSSSPFGAEVNAQDLTRIYREQIERARTIAQPGERAMALEKIGRSAIFTSRLNIAHTALDEARPAALEEPMAVVRDQRIIATVVALLSLAEAQVREAVTDEFVQQTENQAQPNRPLEDRMNRLDLAETEWERAAELALHVSNVNFRTQLLYDLVRSQAGGSQSIANQVQRSSLGQSNLVSQAGPLNAAAERALLSSAAHARLIERPSWRDRALVEVAANAALSNQFGRGTQVARTIPQPEARTEALLRIAESQARRDFKAGATASYAEVAQTIASVPQRDPRMILAGVLIDSLVSVGRFDDARACIILYPDYSNQILALGAIAESQGSRGRAEAARAWIGRDAPAEYRPYLFRKVNDGILAAIDRNRSSQLSNQGPAR